MRADIVHGGRSRLIKALWLVLLLVVVGVVALGAPAHLTPGSPFIQTKGPQMECQVFGATASGWRTAPTKILSSEIPRVGNGLKARRPSLVAAASDPIKPGLFVYLAGVLSDQRGYDRGFYITRLRSSDGGVDTSFRPQGGRHPGHFIARLPTSEVNSSGVRGVKLRLNSLAVDESSGLVHSLLSGEIVLDVGRGKSAALKRRKGFAFDSHTKRFIWAPTNANTLEPYRIEGSKEALLPFIRDDSLYTVGAAERTNIAVDGKVLRQQIWPSSFAAKEGLVVTRSKKNEVYEYRDTFVARKFRWQSGKTKDEFQVRFLPPAQFQPTSIQRTESGYYIFGIAPAVLSEGSKGVVVKLTLEGALDNRFGSTEPGILQLQEDGAIPVSIAVVGVKERKREVLVVHLKSTDQVALYELTTGTAVIKLDNGLSVTRKPSGAFARTAFLGTITSDALISLHVDRRGRGKRIVPTCLSTSRDPNDSDPGQFALPYHNYTNPCDVDGDGGVDEDDGVGILNWLNDKGNVSIPDAPQGSQPPYVDVDGDNTITASDFFLFRLCVDETVATPLPTNTIDFATPTATADATPSSTVTALPTETTPLQASSTPTATGTLNPIVTNTPTRTVTESHTPTPTRTHTPTPTPTFTSMPDLGVIKGSFEGVTRTLRGLEAFGWACRPSSATPVTVTISLGSQVFGSGIASNKQPSVMAECGGRTAHGFSIPLRVPSTLEVAWKPLTATANDAGGTTRLSIPAVVSLTAGDVFPLFGDSYPKGIFFRGGLESINTTNQGVITGKAPDIDTNRPQWLADLTKLSGAFGKALTEEYLTVHTQRSAQNLTDIANEPEQLTLLHFNGTGVQPDWPEAQLFGPQDWLYLEGCASTGPITVNGTDITVPSSCVSRFKKCVTGPKSGEPGAPACIPENLVAVEQLSDGRLNWAKTEYLKVTDLNPTTSTLTVSRGEFGTTAKNFSPKVYIAPFSYNGPWPTWSDQISWNFNFARSATQNKLVQGLVTYLGNGGILSAIDGIILDISFWNTMRNQGRKVDFNVDGVADEGYQGAANMYARGLLEFHRKLKDALGPTKVVLADGWNRSARHNHILNGSESEGFSSPEDGEVRSWSTGLNFINYSVNRISRPHLKYVVTKNLETIGALRLSMAGATALGAALGNIKFPEEYLSVCNDQTEKANYRNRNGVPIADEMVGGTLNRKLWLGRARESVRRPVFSAPNEHPAGVSDLRELAVGVGDVSVTMLADRTEIMPATGTPREFSVVIKGDTSSRRLRAVDTSDYSLVLDVKSEGPLDGFEDEPLVPRKLAVTSNGQLPAAQSGTLESPFGQQWTRLVFFYRNQFPNEDLTFTLKFEGSRAVSIRSVRLKHASDVLIRRFDNGLVIANPSLRPVQVNVKSLYPNLYPGAPYRRLTASTCQDGAHNNGSVVGESITLPGQDGIFLINNEAQPVAHVYMIAGQSNAVGLGRAAENLPSSVDSNIFFGYRWYKGSIAAATTPRSSAAENENNWTTPSTTPVALQRQLNRGGAEFTLGRGLFSSNLCNFALCSLHKIALGKYAVGGSSLARDWLSTSATEAQLTRRFEVYMTQYLTALKSQNVIPKVSGLLWIQGEADSASDEWTSAYESNLENFISSVRDWSDEPTLPVVIAELREVWANSPAHRQRIISVRDAQRRVAAGTRFVETIPTEGLSASADDLIHYDQAGIDELGRRAFAAFQNMRR